jgi:ubiquinone/menaquinone biosynthesis C-methylase UbiE
MEFGKNVDIQARSNYLPFRDNIFDNVICLETLEHDEKFWESIPEMIRVLKNNGTLAITASGIGFHKHNYPSDYWRFTEESIRTLLKPLKNVFVMEDETIACVFGYGRKV